MDSNKQIKHKSKIKIKSDFLHEYPDYQQEKPEPIQSNFLWLGISIAVFTISEVILIFSI
jgi:hypothetical protein